MQVLAVRPLTPVEVPFIVNYLVNATAADRQRMGLAKLPPADVLSASYIRACTTPESDATSFYMIWLVDGQPIGFSSLKGIIRGQSAGMHLHIWDASMRGKGYGGVLFCLSALEFYRRFALQNLVCEPRSANPMPNRLMDKIGFPLIKTYVGASSELSAVDELNCYDIARDIAEAYLLSFGVDPAAATLRAPAQPNR